MYHVNPRLQHLPTYRAASRSVPSQLESNRGSTSTSSNTQCRCHWNNTSARPRHSCSGWVGLGSVVFNYHYHLEVSAKESVHHACLVGPGFVFVFCLLCLLLTASASSLNIFALSLRGSSSYHFEDLCSISKMPIRVPLFQDAYPPKFGFQSQSSSTFTSTNPLPLPLPNSDSDLLGLGVFQVKLFGVNRIFQPYTLIPTLYIPLPLPYTLPYNYLPTQEQY
jgi:hypothetical protein